MGRSVLKALLDTNVVIDLLSGKIEADEEAARYSWLGISRITWMEVLVGTRDEEDFGRVADFLRRFSIVELDDEVARRAIELRQQYRLKLPDAIIWASARMEKGLLVTRNSNDFPARDPGIRVPYKL